MKRLLFLASLVLSFVAKGQILRSKFPLSDSLAQKQLRNFGRSTFEFGLGETVSWVLDHYVSRESWANISFKSMGHNFKPSSWAWDNDEFQTNQIGHPFHGSIFFNSFRSNGYNFWQSVPASFAGSYVWETLGETQAPSINDFINT